jgi:hypothetical protein
MQMDVDYRYFQEESGRDQTFPVLETVQSLGEYQKGEYEQYILLGKLGHLKENREN